MAKIKAIITGSTGMVGEGVLHVCLDHPEVEEVLVISRKPCGITHKKLKEIIHNNFQNLSDVKHLLSGYNACFFCSGISSIGKKEQEYYQITYELTIHVAETLLNQNPDMKFCYVSGAGTDSSEKGKIMWARVKGKTENRLLAMPFKASYMFRPGFIQPIKGLKNTYLIYKLFAPLYPLIKILLPKYVCRLEEIGLAMIYSTLKGSDKKILNSQDITGLSKTF